MDLKDIKNLITNEPEAEEIHWGSAFSLWDVCRFKVIGIPVLDLLSQHVKDSDLRMLIKTGTETIAIPHVEKMQRFLQAHGLTYPALPQRNNIDDQQIARAIKEILRLALVHDIHAFMSTTREEERSLFFDVLNEDCKTFNNIVELNRKKGWLFNPPNRECKLFCVNGFF